MPFYDLKCMSCKNTDINVFSKIASLDSQRCSVCHGPTKVVFLTARTVEVFPSQWMEHIDKEPQYVTSKKQLRNICAKNDLTCYYSIDGERGPSVGEV